MSLLGPLQILVVLTAALATALAQTTISAEDGQKEEVNSKDVSGSAIDTSQMDLLSGIPTVGATVVGIIQLVPPPVKRQSVHLENLLEWLTDRIENDFMVTMCSCAGKCHTQTYEPNEEALKHRIRSNIGISGINRCTGSELLTAEDLVAIIQEGSGNTLLHLARLAGYPHMNRLIKAVNIIQYSPTHGRSVITWQLLGLAVMYYIPRFFSICANLILRFWRCLHTCLRRIRNRPPIDRSYASRLAFDYRMADLARHRMIFQHTPWVRFGLYYIMMELRKKHMSVQKWTDGDERGDDILNNVVDTYRMDYMLKVALIVATDKCSAARLLYSIALHSIRVMSLFRYVGSAPPYVVTSSFSTVACKLHQTTLVISHEKINELYWHMYPPADADHEYGSTDSHHAHSAYDLMIKIFCSSMGDMVLDSMDTRVLINLALIDLPVSMEDSKAAPIARQSSITTAGAARTPAPAEDLHDNAAGNLSPIRNPDASAADSLASMRNSNYSAAGNLSPIRNPDASATGSLASIRNSDYSVAGSLASIVISDYSAADSPAPIRSPDVSPAGSLAPIRNSDTSAAGSLASIVNTDYSAAVSPAPISNLDYSAASISAPAHETNNSDTDILTPIRNPGASASGSLASIRNSDASATSILVPAGHTNDSNEGSLSPIRNPDASGAVSLASLRNTDVGATGSQMPIRNPDASAASISAPADDANYSNVGNLSPIRNSDASIAGSLSSIGNYNNSPADILVSIIYSEDSAGNSIAPGDSTRSDAA
ncbi:hypothetical protein H4R20_004040, partial [Coemansia guatemalensis]